MSETPQADVRPIGIDNYGLFPLDLSPMATLEWAVRHGADGVSFSGIEEHHRRALDDGALSDLGAFARDHDLYLEWGNAQHIPRDMTTWARKELADINARAAGEARHLGARIVRSCSGGLMRWNAASPPTEELLVDTAGALRAMLPMLRDLDLVLAIETHFEFTSFELLRLFEMCDVGPGDALGVCLDTMNLLTMIEHPLWASERLMPWVVSTHVKDGGILLGADGLTTFPVAIGEGVIDLAWIIDHLPDGVTLSVEGHGGSFVLPIHDPEFLGRFPDVTGSEMAALVELSEMSAGKLACRPLDRAKWPRVCDSRMASDLWALRTIAERGLEAQT